MKHKTAAAFWLALVLCTIAVSGASAADFRSSTWGMTEKQMKAAEGDVTWRVGDGYAGGWEYDAWIGGNECTVRFQLVSGKLESGEIRFQGLPVNDLCAYDNLQAALEDQYGTPVLEGWSPYFGSKTDRVRSATWETDTTEIELSEIKQMESGVYCGADDYMFYITVYYCDISGNQKISYNGL
jgi:hypothetical protein